MKLVQVKPLEESLELSKHYNTNTLQPWDLLRKVQMNKVGEACILRQSNIP